MKGGVGKTMTTLNVASMYSKNNKKVLILDLDLFNGCIAFALNLNIKGTIYNICDDIANNRYKGLESEDYIVSYNEYIDVLSAPKDPRQAVKIDRKYIEMILNNYSYKYDVILIDTNHILTVTNIMAFECSDYIIDLFTNDSFDLKNTKTFVSLCQNIGVENLILVLNNSVNTGKNYYSMFDIKNIIKKNVDYVISPNMYLKNVDSYIMAGNIDVLHKKLNSEGKKEYEKFTSLLLKLLENKEVNDEKK